MGRVQHQVLSSLLGRDATIRSLAADWPGLTDSSVHGAISRLYRQGMVEPVRWESGARVWTITRKGQEAFDAEGEEE